MRNSLQEIQRVAASSSSRFAALMGVTVDESSIETPEAKKLKVTDSSSRLSDQDDLLIRKALNEYQEQHRTGLSTEEVDKLLLNYERKQIQEMRDRVQRNGSSNAHNIPQKNKRDSLMFTHQRKRQSTREREEKDQLNKLRELLHSDGSDTDNNGDKRRADALHFLSQEHEDLKFDRHRGKKRKPKKTTRVSVKKRRRKYRQNARQTQ